MSFILSLSVCMFLLPQPSVCILLCVCVSLQACLIYFSLNKVCTVERYIYRRIGDGKSNLYFYIVLEMFPE